MTLPEEIAAVHDLLDLARRAAAEHLTRAASDLHLAPAPLTHYQDFLDTTLRNADTTLAHARELASAPAAPAAAMVPGLLAIVRDSARSVYLVMAILEAQRPAPVPTPPVSAAPVPAPPVAPRSCSFCGKTDAETKLVAGPAANICAACARLACGVLGLAPP
jgi:hypothetical protein